MKPAVYNTQAYRHNSFAVDFDLHYDVEPFDYYAQLKDKQGNIVANFTIVKGDTNIILTLDSETMLEIEAGKYVYDVKQVSSSGFKAIIISGEHLHKNGVTETP